MEFYVYTHARPDGSVFYVGKGSGRRAWDFSPRRRSAHHRNIMQKHGRDALVIMVYPCASETEAFALERSMIAALRADGAKLLNRTDGGEGTAGRPISEATKNGLAKGRGKGREMPAESRKRMLEGLARGRQSAAAWRRSAEGLAFVRTLGRISAEATAARDPFAYSCAHCGASFQSRSHRARCCSKRCQQQARRARERANDTAKAGLGDLPNEVPVSP